MPVGRVLLFLVLYGHEDKGGFSIPSYINIETGEIIEDVRYLITDRFLSTSKENSKYKSIDSFIFLNFKKEYLNIDKSIFTQSEIARIIYISAFLKNENRLMLSERVPLTIDSLKKKMNLNDKVFKRFLKKIFDFQIVVNKDDDLYFDRKIAFFGGIPRKSKYNFTRLYSENFQYIYENSMAREHKKIACLLCLIPYINMKYNILCTNIFETEIEKIQPLNQKDIGYILGYSKQGTIDILKYLENLKLKNQEPVISKIENLYLVNKSVIYAGNSFDII